MWTLWGTTGSHTAERNRNKEHSFLHKSHFYMSNNVINMNKQHGPFYNSPRRLLNSSEEACICNSGSVKREDVCGSVMNSQHPRVSLPSPSSTCSNTASFPMVLLGCGWVGYRIHFSSWLVARPQRCLGGNERTSASLAKSAPCWEELHLRLRQTDRC